MDLILVSIGLIGLAIIFPPIILGYLIMAGLVWFYINNK
jgi:hypothetical protein